MVNKKTYRKESLLGYLIEYNKAKGNPPKVSDFKKNSKYPNPHLYYNVFGSWNNALKLANLPTRKQGGEKKLSNQEMLEKVKSYYLSSGKIPKHSEFPSTYSIRFGSWNKVLTNAGIPISRKHYSDNELINFLKKVSKQLGLTPKRRDFDNYPGQHPKSSAYTKRFGSWNKAIKKADLTVTKEMKYTEEMVLTVLKEFESKNRRLPKAIDFQNHNPDWHIIMRILKCASWSEVLVKAGYKKRKWPRYNDLAIKWEKFVEVAVKSLYPDAIPQKKFIIDEKISKPDNYIPSEDMIIDAKLSNYDMLENVKRFEKYSKITRNIQFWCLQKLANMKELPVKYVFAKQILELLDKSNQKELVARCKSFIELDDTIRNEAGLWTKERLIVEFRRFHKEFGKCPNPKELDSTPSYPSYNTFVRVFGSWRKFKTQLDLEMRKESYTKDDIKKLILTFYIKNGRLPKTKEFRKKFGIPSTRSIILLFGSLRKCYEFCGLDSARKYRSKKELLDLIKGYCEETGKIPKSRDFRRCDGKYPNPATYINHFGSWNKALVKAGLKPYRPYTKEELIDILRTYYKEKGKVPKAQVFQFSKKKYPSPTTYIRYFGSWNNALVEAELEVSKGI